MAKRKGPISQGPRPVPIPKVTVEVVDDDGHVAIAYTENSLQEAEAMCRGIDVGLELCSNSSLSARIVGKSGRLEPLIRNQK